MLDRQVAMDAGLDLWEQEEVRGQDCSSDIAAAGVVCCMDLGVQRGCWARRESRRSSSMSLRSEEGCSGLWGSRRQKWPALELRMCWSGGPGLEVASRGYCFG